MLPLISARTGTAVKLLTSPPTLCIVLAWFARFQCISELKTRYSTCIQHTMLPNVLSRLHICRMQCAMSHIQLPTLAPCSVHFCWPAVSLSSLWVQGAVAVEGEGHLWRPSRRGSTAAAQDAPASASVQPAQTTPSSTIDESPAGSQDTRAAGLFCCNSVAHCPATVLCIFWAAHVV